MKKRLPALIITCLLLTTRAIAGQWIIEDNYIGGGASDYQQNGGDVISLADEINLYDITGMTVDIDDAIAITVSIITDYSPQWAKANPC